MTIPTPRTVFLDRLRILLIVLVVLHHTAITYGATGGWYWRDPSIPATPGPSAMLLSLFCAVNQAFFMGFFFLISGYLTPGAVERKSAWRFFKDRIVRLGIPLLVFGFVVGPLTIAMAVASENRPFIATLLSFWSRPLFNIGPLWFAEALLLFAVGYLLWRVIRRQRTTSANGNLPSHRLILFSALGVGAAAFAVRLAVPVSKEVFGLQLGYFASYVFLYATGCAAWDGRWLERSGRDLARPWLLVSLLLIPALVALLAFTDNLAGVEGGWNIKAVTYAFWEPFVAWGIILSLLWLFRVHGNEPNSSVTWLSERAYAVYIVHPPVLVGIALLLRDWTVSPLAKFAITGTLACAACVAIASLLLLVPGARRVL